MNGSSHTLPRQPRSGRRRLVPLVLAVAMVGSTLGTANATTEVPAGPGDTWQVHDDVSPRLDTGSIRVTGDRALMGYGGLRVEVADGTSPLNGILLRGFGTTFDQNSTFNTTRGVEIDGLVVRRTLTVDADGGYGRFFDTFDNTTDGPLDIEVAFGGQLGYDTGTNQSAIAGTSDGDDVISAADGWASWYAPSDGEGSFSARGPSATTVGTPGYSPSLDRMGNFLRDPFVNDLPTTGDEANHPAFMNRITVPADRTVSLARFVVTGQSETEDTAGEQVAAVQEQAEQLTVAPDLTGLSTAEVCSLANYDVDTLPGVDRTTCRAPQNVLGSAGLEGTEGVVLGETTSNYDVVGKSIADLVADMDAGVTTAEEITQAYLDRIDAYDGGPFGFRSVLVTAPDALEQARAADVARAEGDDRPLLGIPILVKDLLDTKDMPTTGGSFFFEGYQPPEDAWQVAQLRDAGALILGKANLAAFATNGHYSPSDFGQVWNAFDPSRSPIGSSGGSSVAVASSFAAAAIGSQTGDSLWGPAGAASVFSLRGTDGMQSSAGTMPLTIIQDYVGFFTQTPEDLATLLEVAAVDNPDDVLDDVANGNRPDDWSEFMTPDALQGKVIGLPEDAFTDPFGTSVVSDALTARFADFEEAGATFVEMPSAPTPGPREFGGSTNFEGWSQWIEAHPDNPYSTPEEFGRNSGERMTDEDQRGFEQWRADYRALLADWMDDSGVDVVLFPTHLSDIHLNDSINPSFGRRDPQSSASGVPTMIFPAGVNAHDQVIGFQLQGKEFQDAELLGMAYAFDAVANGRVLPDITPPLPVAETTDPPVGNVCDRHQGGASFPDAPGSGHRAFIDCLAELGVVEGYADGTYGPRGDVSRGQLASFVVRAIELATGEDMESGGAAFPDVGRSSTHGQAIYKLRDAGIIEGFEDGTFRPGQSVTREQTARYVTNSLELVLGAELETSGATFPDVPSGSQYATDVDQLVTAGIIGGFEDGTFGPRQPVTRAQMARFIGNALEVVAQAGAYEGP